MKNFAPIDVDSGTVSNWINAHEIADQFVLLAGNRENASDLKSEIAAAVEEERNLNGLTRPIDFETIIADALETLRSEKWSDQDLPDLDPSVSRPALKDISRFINVSLGLKWIGKFGPRIKNLSKGKDTAGDLEQDVALKFTKMLEKGNSTVKSFLALTPVSIYSEFCSSVRKTKKDNITCSLDEMQEQRGDLPHPTAGEHEVYRKILVEEMYSALSLSEDKEIFRLKILGFTEGEIALRLQIEEVTVRSGWGRILKSLKELIKDANR